MKQWLKKLCPHWWVVVEVPKIVNHYDQVTDVYNKRYELVPEKYCVICKVKRDA